MSKEKKIMSDILTGVQLSFILADLVRAWLAIGNLLKDNGVISQNDWDTMRQARRDAVDRMNQTE